MTTRRPIFRDGSSPRRIAAYPEFLEIPIISQASETVRVSLTLGTSLLIPLLLLWGPFLCVINYQQGLTRATRVIKNYRNAFACFENRAVVMTPVALLIDFRWPVAGSGYEWTTGMSAPAGNNGLPELGPPIEVLAESPNPDLRPRRVVEASEDTALFREFSQIAPSKEGIRGFANSYGLLGGHCTKRIAVRRDGEGSLREGWGEPLDIWKAEIAKLRVAVELWDRAQSGPLEDVDDLVKLEPTDTEATKRPLATSATGISVSLYDPFDRQRMILTTSVFSPEIAAQGRVGYLRFALNEFVNGQIADEVSPRLAWDTGAAHGRLVVAPRSLRSMLWLQLAAAISADRRYRACAQCGKEFELSADAIRTSRRYCSESCRAKAYRTRQSRAAEMHAAGVAIEEIADELGAQPEAVAAWVSGKRRRRARSNSERSQ